MMMTMTRSRDSIPAMAIPSYDQQTERPRMDVFQQGLLKLTAAALADKSLLWVSLLGGIGIWSFAIGHPDVLRLVAAGGYSLGIFVPILYKKG